MNQPEIDALVERIGDELLSQLGLARKAATSSSNGVGCACSHQEASPAPAALTGDALKRVDLEALAPETDVAAIDAACARAVAKGLRGVCVPMGLVPRAARVLEGKAQRVCGAVDVPHGASIASLKIAGVEAVYMLGADEAELMIHTGSLRDGRLDEIFAEISGAAKLAAAAGRWLTIAVDAPLLNEEQLIRAAAMAAVAGAHCVSTGSGLNSHAPVAQQHIKLLRQAAGDRLEVKASGTASSLQSLLAAGAHRVSTADHV